MVTVETIRAFSSPSDNEHKKKTNHTTTTIFPFALFVIDRKFYIYLM